jgi:hypothetical protein|tara:strand:+ start:406 stop:591 length:186 start_codon:yes stop_codon:yes gene_type:complete
MIAFSKDILAIQNYVEEIEEYNLVNISKLEDSLEDQRVDLEALELKVAEIYTLLANNNQDK